MSSGNIRVAVILNGISRKKRSYYKNVHPELEKHFELKVFETQHATHARQLGTEAAQSGFTHVLAGGGDGTLHQVMNGVLSLTSPKENKVRIGVIPLGTGNDFARTCGISLSVQKLISLIRNGGTITDIGEISCRNDKGELIRHYFINVCSLGMGPEVVRRLAGDSRFLGPDLTYLKAILATFATHRSEHLSLKANNWETSGDFRVVAIANGRTFGHRITVGPEARIDDGLFSIFLAGDLPWWKFIYCLQLAKMGRRIFNPQIRYETAQSLQLTSALSSPVEAEGEWLGWLPAEIRIIPGGISFLR